MQIKHVLDILIIYLSWYITAIRSNSSHGNILNVLVTSFHYTYNIVVAHHIMSGAYVHCRPPHITPTSKKS